MVGCLLFSLKKNYFIQRETFGKFSRFEKLHKISHGKIAKVNHCEPLSLISGQFFC